MCDFKNGGQPVCFGRTLLFKQRNDEALLLLIASSLRSNEHVCVRNYYEITIPKKTSEVISGKVRTIAVKVPFSNSFLA